jgi:flagellar FliJ protein
MDTLLTLLRHAEDERDRCRASVSSVAAQHQAAQLQYEQLTGYRSEYEARWQNQFSQHGAMELVHAYQGFMLRLTQAVEQQRGVVQQIARQLEAARSTLREHEIRHASVRKLIERRAQRERVALNRREQKLNDEQATRAPPDSVLPAELAWMN